MSEPRAIIRIYEEISASQVDEIVKFLDENITVKFSVIRIQKDETLGDKS